MRNNDNNFNEQVKKGEEINKSHDSNVSIEDREKFSEKEDQNSAEVFWSFFTSPQVNPLELYILSLLFDKSQTKGGIFFDHDDLSLIIAEAIQKSQELGFDKNNLPNSIRFYSNALSTHQFLFYDVKARSYTLTQAGIHLGKTLWNLNDPLFLECDNQYLEGIISKIRDILANWKKTIFKVFDREIIIQQNQYQILYDLLIKFSINKQEILNFNHVTAQIFNLSQQAIEIGEELKKITSTLQSDYIKSIHQRKDINQIKSNIDTQIELYGIQIERLNKKSYDINMLIQRNKRSINRIDVSAEEIRFLFEEIKNKYFKDPITILEKEINSLLDQLISLCIRIYEFSSQLNFLIFDITIKRVSMVQFLFKYLQELIQNTQLLGDLYNIWRIGIYENIEGLNSCDFSSLRVFEPLKLLKPDIEGIFFGDFHIPEVYDEDLSELEHMIESRNLESNSDFEEAKRQTQQYLKEAEEWQSLILDILNEIENSDSVINLDRLLFQISRETSFSDARFYPRFFSEIWEQLTNRYNEISLQSTGENIHSVSSLYEFENGKLIQINNTLLKLSKKER